LEFALFEAALNEFLQAEYETPQEFRNPED
jgi:hypothetical protein